MKIFLFIFIAVFQINMVNAFAQNNEFYLTSYDNNFYICALNGNNFIEVSKLNFNGVTELKGPTYNKSNGDLYFEAHPEMEKVSYIFKYNAKTKKLEKIFKGEEPFLSPDGSKLAYYHQISNAYPKLYIVDLESMETYIVEDDFGHQPTLVWVSEDRFLYKKNNGNLSLFNVTNGQNQDTGLADVWPSALSPDGTRVLCSSTDLLRIYLYYIETNKLEMVERNFFLKNRPEFIWRPDGKSFIYARQSWSNTIKIDEEPSLFLYSVESKSEKKIKERFYFLGGVEVGEEFLK
jgi:hypothetical protein